MKQDAPRDGGEHDRCDDDEEDEVQNTDSEVRHASAAGFRWRHPHMYLHQVHDMKLGQTIRMMELYGYTTRYRQE